MSDFFDDIENVEIEKPEVKSQNIFDSLSSYYRMYISRSNVACKDYCPGNDFFYKKIITRNLQQLTFHSGTDIHWKVLSFGSYRKGTTDEYDICVDVFGTFSVFSDFCKFINAINILPKFKSGSSSNDVFFKLTEISSFDIVAEFYLHYENGNLTIQRYSESQITFVYEFAEHFMNKETGFRDLDSRNPKLSALYKLSKPGEPYLDHMVDDVTTSFMDFIVHHNDKFYAGSSLNKTTSGPVPPGFEYSDKALNRSSEILRNYVGEKHQVSGLPKLLKSGLCDMTTSKVRTAIGMLYSSKMSQVFIWDGWSPKSFCPKTNMAGYPHMWWNYVIERMDELCSNHNKRELKCTIAEDKKHKNKYIFSLYLGEIFDVVSSGQFQRMDPMNVVICFHGTIKSIKKCVDMLYE